MASNAVLFMGWSQAARGREREAGELFMQFMGFLQKKQEDGAIESFEPIILDRHGGDMNGFTLVRGEIEKLVALRKGDDFVDLELKVLQAVDGWGVITGHTGEGVQTIMTKWMAIVTS